MSNDIVTAMKIVVLTCVIDMPIELFKHLIGPTCQDQEHNIRTLIDFLFYFP